MKATLALLCAALVALHPFHAAAQETAPTPVPPLAPTTVVVPIPVATPQQFEATATAWVKAIVAVLGLVTTLLLPAVAYLWATVHQTVKRQDRQAENTGSMQAQITANARALPATPEAASMPAPPPAVGPLVALACLLGASMLMGGCAGLPDRTYSLFVQDRDGDQAGATLHLGDTRTGNLASTKGLAK